MCKIHCPLWANVDHHAKHCQQWSTVISNLGEKCDAIRKEPKEATKMVARKLYISRTISKNNGFQTFPQGINSSFRDNFYCFVMYKAINSCWDWLIAKAKLRHVINLKSHLLWVCYKAIEIIAVAQQTITENTQTHRHTQTVVFFSRLGVLCCLFPEFFSLTKASNWPYSKLSTGKGNALRTSVLSKGEVIFILLVL